MKSEKWPGKPGHFFCSREPCERRGSTGIIGIHHQPGRPSHKDPIIDPHQTLLQTCRALEIQGLYSQALDALNTAAATGGNLKISEQAVRLCLLTAAWQDLPRWSERYRQHCEDHLSRRGESRHAPGILNYLPDSQDLHRRAAGYYASQLSTGAEKLNPGLSAGDGRLAIGYLSADFQAHAVGFLLADVFQHHDREKFRVIAYDLSPADGPLPDRFRT
ncbi:MAG: hypothetical protein IH927_09115, partial [Proteobacteria bacterium]|nr:hypothetical protein [Pseudomonadota bacterium]